MLFLPGYARQTGQTDVASVLPLEALAYYDFPGNVRELENILKCILALCPDAEIGRDGLRLASVEVLQDTAALLPAVFGDGLPLQDYLDRLEKESIIEALKKTRYNCTTVARFGITARYVRYAWNGRD